jgi:uncharacterized protein (TIGR03067 family)
VDASEWTVIDSILTAFVALVSFGGSPATSGPVDDLKALQGTWQIITSQSAGEGTNEERNRNVRYRLVVEGSSLTFISTRGGADTKDTAEFRLLTSQSPKGLDIVIDGKARNECIYELSGDRLRVCIGHSDADRPKKLAPAKEATLFTLRRASP